MILPRLSKRKERGLTRGEISPRQAFLCRKNRNSFTKVAIYTNIMALAGR
jgi:hypothetical protein